MKFLLNFTAGFELRPRAPTLPTHSGSGLWNVKALAWKEFPIPMNLVDLCDSAFSIGSGKEK